MVLEKALFSHYTYNPTAHGDEAGDESEPDAPTFGINLDALLETLQIFGLNDGKDRWSAREPTYAGVAGARGGFSAAFDNQVLGMSGICKMTYASEGAPLCIIIEESGVTTTCELNTYESEHLTTIPIQNNAIAHKIIMRASWLYDAINELSATSPTRLTIVASPSAPYFTLFAAGPHGSATVEFSKDPQLLETFQVKQRVSNTYKYALVKGASRAMSMASKVSIRGDESGVLSLQFMIEVEGGAVTFVDFRFVAYIAEEDDDAGEDEEDEGGEEEEYEEQEEEGEEAEDEDE